MKRIIVKNLLGQKTHGAEIDDPTSWIAEQVSANSWGLSQRKKWKNECSPEELLLIISEEEITIHEGGTRTEATLKATFTYEILDIQSEIDQENQKQSQIQNFKQSVKSILQKADADVTTAEVKTALLKFLRASLLKGELD